MSTIALTLLIQLFGAAALASMPEYFVTRISYEERDCLTNAKVRSQRLPEAAVVSILAVSGNSLRVLELENGRELCIKAKKGDLLSIEPLRAGDGSKAVFPDQREGISRPRRRGGGAMISREEIAAIDAIPLALLEAWVVFIVEGNGKVSDCRVWVSSGFAEWDDWGKRMACWAEFEPALKNGSPVAVTQVRKVARSGPGGLFGEPR